MAFARAVCWHPLNFYFDVAIRMVLEEHRQQGSGIRVAYLLDADLVGNRRVPKLEMLDTDLEYADNMALLANNWSDLTAMLDSLYMLIQCKLQNTIVM